MMKIKTENKYSLVKQLVVFPLLAFLIMGLANREVKTVIVHNERHFDTEYGSIDMNELADGTDLFSEVVSLNTQMALYNNAITSDEKNVPQVILSREMETLVSPDNGSELVGRVLSSDTRKPVPSLSIYNRWGNKIAETNKDGVFAVDRANLDNTVFFQARGYAGYAKISESNESGKIADVYIDPVNEFGQAKSDLHKLYEVDEKPQFPGGEEALARFIAHYTRYPRIALENGIMGRVFVNFIIDKTGNVKNARIERGVDASLDKEALRVVNSLPKWKPGRVDGKIVEVDYTVPVNFELPSNWVKPKSRQLELTGDPVYIVNGREFKGHISEIKVDDIENVTVIKGKEAVAKYGEKATAGVVIIETRSSIPITGNDPLIIVDGVVYELDINSIHPSTIERIDVLKDESATAIYGEKGKNGVILITMKDKTADNPTITNSNQLRRAIAERIKYPVVAQEAGQTGKIELFAEISRDGKIVRISETVPDASFETLDEVVIVAYASEKTVSPDVDFYFLRLLKDESSRVIKTLPKFEIPEFQGKWVKFQFNFLLQ